jgi:hypothetical protein
MSARRSRPSPGTGLHALADRLLDRHTLHSVMEPAIADMQHETRLAGPRRLRRYLALSRGYISCGRALLLGLVSRRSLMRLPLRRWLAALGCCAAVALFLVGMHLPVPLFVFAVISLVLVSPIVLTALTIAARWGWSPAFAAACAAVPLGYLVGGMIGWASVPPEWSASLLVTIDASMNAAKYGPTFEHTAERALLYFVYSGIIGALVTGAASTAVARTIARRRQPTGG